MRSFRKILAYIFVLLFVSAFSSCSKSMSIDLKTGKISSENVTAVCSLLKSKGLSDTDVFREWVSDYIESDKKNGDVSGFSDADCRLTVMLLAGDSIKSDSVKESYDGTYLMFDVEAIDNQEQFNVLRDKRNLFATLFGEMPVPEGDFDKAYENNLEKYGITFGDKDYSIINLLFKAYEEDYAFVGHTGILIDCSDVDGAEKRYLFVEKIAYYDDYLITFVEDEKELLGILSERPDYFVEEGEPRPIVYNNDRCIGKLG